MASPLSTYKQMFSLMKRETHHHPEVQHLLSQQEPRPEPEWIDLDIENHIEKLKALSSRSNPGKGDDDGDDGHDNDDDHRQAA